MSVVTFDYSQFTARYPEFASLSSETATLYFNEACLHCDNTNSSLITDTTVRGMILNMLTAHIAKLATMGTVGRLAYGKEGTVIARFDYVPASAGRAWFDQTPYGASAWQAMSTWRTAFYVAPKTLPFVIVPGEG